MAPKNVNKMTVGELKKLARKRGLRGYSKLKKSDLVKLLESVLPKKEGKAPKAKPVVRVEKPVPALAQAPAPAPAPESFDDGHVLPQSYGTTRLVLLPKNYQWAFVYWDVDSFSRMRLLQGTPKLGIYRGDQLAAKQDLDLESGRYYLEIPDGQGDLRVVLACERDGQFEEIVHSNSISLPRAKISGNATLVFGTPDWVSGKPGPTTPPRPMTEEQLHGYLGKVPNDVPWYRSKRTGNR